MENINAGLLEKGMFSDLIENTCLGWEKDDKILCRVS